MKLELWGGENLLEPKRFAAIVKALGHSYDNLAAVEKKVKSKRPGFDQVLTGAAGSVRLTRDGRLEGTLAQGTAVAVFTQVAAIGAFAEGTLEPVSFEWRDRGAFSGYLLPKPGWVMFLNEALAEPAAHPQIVQLADTPEKVTVESLHAFEQRLLRVVRASEAKKLGYDFKAVVQQTLGPTLAAAGLQPVEHDAPTEAIYRSGQREAFIRVDVVCGLGTLIELHFYDAQPRPGHGPWLHWPERPSGRGPTTNKWTKKKDVERYLSSQVKAVARATDRWFTKMQQQHGAQASISSEPIDGRSPRPST